MNQKQLIETQEWDVLVVLDALRHDYFITHTDYKAHKATSNVNTESKCATTSWLKQTFPDTYEYTYISATPRVNSVTPIDGYDATQHFTEIIDVWDTGWDTGIGTVRPNVVTNEATQYHYDNPDQKLVVHYLQPHEPYLSISINRNKRDPDPQSRSGLNYHLKRLYGGPLSKWLGHDTVIKFCEGFELKYVNQMHQIVGEEGKQALRDYYVDNLNQVMRSVESLINRLSGTVIVTSDHGEYLGEQGYYGHSYVPDSIVVRDVPWCVV